MAESDVPMRAFDQTRNVRDRRSTISGKLNHADNRMQRRERIRRHFRPRRRNSPKQSRLPSIRITDQSRIRYCSQLKQEMTLLALLAFGVFAWRAIPRT